MARYKWASPQEWLTETREKMVHEASAKATFSALQEVIATLLDDLNTLVSDFDGDTIQDAYQSEMDKDGYFNDLDITAKLSREQCVDLLEGAGIQCYDTETVEELREAVQSNIEDGTIAYGDVKELTDEA